ncbi:MAG: aminotransferase class IV [Planctomycetes bacterium]|nr:aminotransferase class IV [Planctomycetota bacterium]
MTAIRSFCESGLERGFHLGDGVFETVLVTAGRASFLGEHIERMRRSCSKLAISMPLDLLQGVSEVLPAMHAEEGSPARAALRISVSRGPWTGLGADDVTEPGVVLVLRAVSPPAVALDAVILDAPRIDPLSPLAGHKVLSWMDKVEARRLARARGAHVALLRTTDGDVAEADAANLFVVVGGSVVTPTLSRGVLPGITRARVLAALRSRGATVEERRVSMDDVRNAGEAFVTSSLAGVQILRTVDGRRTPGAALASSLREEVQPDRDSGGTSGV